MTGADSAASPSRRPVIGVGFLLAPCILLVAWLIGLPLLNLLYESFRAYEAGSVGAAEDAAMTLQNYRELLHPAYFGFLWDTIWISGLSALLALFFGFLIAYRIARTRSKLVRKTYLILFVALMFLSVLVRVYAIVLTFGPGGIGEVLIDFLGVRTNSRAYAEAMVILGFLHYLVPIATLMLVGTIQNVNPSYCEAAVSLGATRWQAHLGTTLPLASRGLISAFLIVFSLAVSSFVIPLILGRGKVQFLANLAYARFSEVANYPSGAAIAMVLLVMSLILVAAVSRIGRSRSVAA